MQQLSFLTKGVISIMSNLLLWIKSLGVATVSAIAISGNSAIALINQDATLLNHLNISNFSSILKNYNISEDDALKNNSSIDINQTPIQDKDAVNKQEIQNMLRPILDQKILLADCWIDEDGNRICA